MTVQLLPILLYSEELHLFSSWHTRNSIIRTSQHTPESVILMKSSSFLTQYEQQSLTLAIYML